MFLYHLDAVHPGVERIMVSAKTGEGMDEERLARRSARRRSRRRRLRDAGARQRRPRAALRRADAGQRAVLRLRVRTAGALATGWRERFARGGRLIAAGRSPAARSDARHVAGVRAPGDRRQAGAPPALALAGEGGPLTAQIELAAEPDDIVIGFGADDDGGAAAAALAVARERGCLTLAFASAEAEVVPAARVRP